MLKRFHLIFNHTLTQRQIEDAKGSFGIEEMVPLPEDMQSLWSNLPPDMERLVPYLDPLLSYIDHHVTADDVALVQGDFGATCLVVRQIKARGAIAVYATTRRSGVEKHIDGKVVKTSIFEHVRFREYV